MAVALGLPVLVASDEGVEEGVFSPDVWGSQVHGTMVSSPGEAALEWLELVRRHSMLRIGVTGHDFLSDPEEVDAQWEDRTRG
jgi:hypothetical protein